MAGRMRFVKLIRDDMEKSVGDDGRLHYDKLPLERHIEELRKKLPEEGLEYALRPSLDELADLYEAMLCLVVLDLGLTFDDIVRTAAHKREERGSFMEGLGMFMITTAPPRGD